ncbi:mucin-2-like [Musca vetustissima]|uniref:mucin-2-like n=1 Tax=Musca vetustissima TaxID=27455 RepID=UPI002AB76E82|nr:mucin-2-like [Musca vetustissima]
MASTTTGAAIIRDTDSPATANNIENEVPTKRTSSSASPRHTPNTHCHRRPRHRNRILANLLCSECLTNNSSNTSLQSTTDSPPYQLLLPPSSRYVRERYLSAITDKTLDFCASYSTTVCDCSKCPKEDFKFVSVRSFSGSNISSSTPLDYTTSSSASSSSTSSTDDSCSNVTHTTEEVGNYFTPPREYTNNTRALGVLTEKRSPLFGPLAGGISLRTQEPFYSEYLLNANDLISPRSLKAYKENIDYTATEALPSPSMNGGGKRSSMNGGSAITSPATAANGGNVTDINRNGVPKHWFETWPGTQPASLELLPCAGTAATTTESCHPVLGGNSRAIHSDPEERQTKEKVRSRFSTALRKLSRSTRKKDKLAAGKSSSETAAGSAAASDLILSSDADDRSSSPVTKTKIKKKKSSLFSLKSKAKVAPKKDCEGEEEEHTIPATGQRILEPLFHDTENEVVVTTERLSPTEGKRKVQITIKSKKIEKVADSEPADRCPPSSPSPTPTALSQSSPTTTPPLGRQIKNENITSAPTPPSSSSTKEDKKKKLKGKLKTQTSQKPTTPAAAPPTQAQSKKDHKAEEKIVITQSPKDIPPRDKAPAKPSRLAQQQQQPQPSQQPSSSHSACTSSNTNTGGGGAVRKTATTTRAAIKLVTTAKSKKKSEANKATSSSTAGNKPTGGGKGSATTKASDNITTTTANTPDNTETTTTTTQTPINKESDLMINPQRGHRFPRPTSTESTESRSQEIVGNQDSAAATAPPPKATTPLPPSISPSPPPPNSNQPQNNEIQSETKVLSATEDASLPANQASQPTQQQPQSQQQHQPPVTSQDKSSVNNLSANQTDDHISVAESVQPSSTTSAEDIPTNKDTPTSTNQPTVRFTLGNRVRPPLIIAKQLAYEPSSQEPYSIEHQSDDDSEDTPDSDDSRHRRRIRYLATTPSGELEPPATLYDEFNNLELKQIE